MMVSRCVALTRQVPLAAGEYAKYSSSMPDAQLSPSTAGLGAMQCVPGRIAVRHLRRRTEEADGRGAREGPAATRQASAWPYFGPHLGARHECAYRMEEPAAGAPAASAAHMHSAGCSLQRLRVSVAVCTERRTLAPAAAAASCLASARRRPAGGAQVSSSSAHGSLLSGGRERDSAGSAALVRARKKGTSAHTDAASHRAGPTPGWPRPSWPTPASSERPRACLRKEEAEGEAASSAHPLDASEVEKNTQRRGGEAPSRRPAHEPAAYCLAARTRRAGAPPARRGARWPAKRRRRSCGERK